MLADPWRSEGVNEENRTIYGALLKSGVDVITDLNPKIFHQKFIVRDKGNPTAAVLIGSTNFTLTDSGKAAPGNNLSHLLVLHGPKAAEQYLAEFERKRADTFGDLHERVEARPKEFELEGVRIKPLFAPRHGPEMEIMKQMLKAHDSIDVAMGGFKEPAQHLLLEVVVTVSWNDRCIAYSMLLQGASAQETARWFRVNTGAVVEWARLAGMVIRMGARGGIEPVSGLESTPDPHRAYRLLTQEDRIFIEMAFVSAFTARLDFIRESIKYPTIF